MQSATAAGLEVDARAERLEHVGRAALARGRAVAVLRDPAARARRDERGRGRHVEGRPPAAGAGGVDEVVARRRRAGASERIVCARPAISSTVSPFVRSAIRKAAVCASEALPSMISASTRCGLLARTRSWPPASRSIASVRTVFGTASRGSCAAAACRAGVSTDSGWNWTPSSGSSRWRRPMITSPRAGRHLELVRQARGRRQRVVAADHERRLEAAEDRPAVVLDLGGLAVHRLAAHHPAAERRRPAPGGRGRRPAPARRASA